MPTTAISTISTIPANSFAHEVRIPWWRIIVLILASLGVLFLCLSTPSSNGTTEAGVIMQMPIFIDSFMGTDGEPSLSEVTMLPKDTEFAKKIYNNLAGQYLTCQIVLSGGERRSIHRPEICLPGQGWTITDARPISVKLTTGDTQNVMKLTLQRDVQVGPNERRKLNCEFLYWFVGKDKTTADHWQRVILSSWDKIMHNVNHRWAYVIVSAIVPQAMPDKGDPQAETVEMLKTFIGKLAPQIQKPGVVPG